MWGGFCQETNQLVKCSFLFNYVILTNYVRGPPLDSQGGAGVFVAGKLFISTGLGGALKISRFVTCLYGTVLEVNYLFHAESARNSFFQKYSCPPPLWESNGGPLI